MLYIVNKNNMSLKNCVDRAQVGDVILLIESAVSAALSSAESQIMDALEKEVLVYALMPDLQARGLSLSRCDERIQMVDYVGFVELVESNNPIRSYF